MNIPQSLRKIENYITKKRLWSIIVVVFVSMLVTFYCQSPFFKDKYILPDDVRQNVFWMFKFRDKELFLNDIFFRYSSWFSPIGIKAVYFLTSFFADAITIVHLIPFFLCAISALYIFGLGKLLRNNRTGVLLAALYVFVAWYKGSNFFEDGASGDFFPVLLVAFLFYFVKKDYLKCAFTIIIQTIFYPPAVLISLLAYGVSFIKHKQKRLCFEKSKRKLICFFIAVIVSSSIMVPKYLSVSKEFGKIITLQQMRYMPEFYPKIRYGYRVQPEGRVPTFYPSTFLMLTNERSGISLNDSTKFLAMACLILLFLLRRKALEFPEEIWCFLASSCILFVLANIIALKLFEPSRYVKVSIPLFLIIFFVLNSQRWANAIKKFFYKRIIAISLIAAVLIFYLPSLQGDTHNWGDDAKLYEFLSSLPKDILVGGHPRNMDNIPTFSRRKVLVLEELSLPFYPKFYNTIRNRTYSFFKAYYATSPKVFYDFCREYGVTHLVVYKKHFTKDYLNGLDFYNAPFNDYIIDLVRQGRERGFILNRVPENKKLFTAGNCFVIQCDRQDLFDINK